MERILCSTIFGNVCDICVIDGGIAKNSMEDFDNCDFNDESFLKNTIKNNHLKGILIQNGKDLSIYANSEYKDVFANEMQSLKNYRLQGNSINIIYC